MLIELQPHQFKHVEHFFQGSLQYIPALAVLHSNFPGRVFVDDCNQPNFAIVWATSRWIYIEGELNKSNSNSNNQFYSNDKSNQNVVDMLQEIVFQAEPNRTWFEIYTKDNEAWETEFFSHAANLKTLKHYESVYVLNVEKFNTLPNQESNDPSLSCSIEDFPILSTKYIDDHSIDPKYKTKSRFGAKLEQYGKMIALCKNNGFEFEKRYFIDVDTFAESDRGKGYATLVSQRLIHHGFEQGYVPLWETTHENLASHKLAIKLGFERASSYPVYEFVKEGE